MRLFLIILFCALGLAGAPAQADTAFFDGLPDIPVADGLTPLPDETTSFDKPAGRIVQVLAIVNDDTHNSGDIMNYYDQNLPTFGWIKTGNMTYKRGAETLKFWFDSSDDATYFYMQIEP